MKNFFGLVKTTFGLEDVGYKLSNKFSLHPAFMLHKTRVAIRFRAKNPHHRLSEILRWFACGANGLVVGVRSRDCQIFSDG